MSFKSFLSRKRGLGPAKLTRKFLKFCFQKVSNAIRRFKDRYYSSFELDDSRRNLYSYFPLIEIQYLMPHKNMFFGLSGFFLKHRFDLLGSGWVLVKHGMQCRGLEGYKYEMGSNVIADLDGNWLRGRINKANFSESCRIWKLVDKGYDPIDWQLDFKSGFRWAEETWYKDVPYGHKLGVDIKVPWELARMQHLPQLAFAYFIAEQEAGYRREETKIGKSKEHDHADWLDGKGHFLEKEISDPDVYVKEFRNQILDFIASNPPRFGTNWFSTMDVGIRVSNWLVAYDLFKAFGVSFDPEFERIFGRSLYEHGKHIVKNLEWEDRNRNNHYLANIVGLLFIAAYLPCTSEIDGWLVFCFQELINEVLRQFHLDGSNFEASTSYHCLSAEMVIYSTALICNLPLEKMSVLKNFNKNTFDEKDYEDEKNDNVISFPQAYLDRLVRMTEFAMHITKINGNITQIGDNDSGRFLKLLPISRCLKVADAKKRFSNLDDYAELPDDAEIWEENHLDHRHLIAAANGLFKRSDFSRFVGEDNYEEQIIWELSGRRNFANYNLAKRRPNAYERVVGLKQDWKEFHSKLKNYPDSQVQTIEIPFPKGNIYKKLKWYAYLDFGLFIFRSKRLFLAIRCGQIGQNGNGGHAHNDQLSIELNIDGRDLITDPGTYLYTPLPDKRNVYRSVKAHFAPILENNKEPGSLKEGIFTLGNEADAVCIYFGNEGFLGMHGGYGGLIYRMIEFADNGLRIIDCSTGDLRLKKIDFSKKISEISLSPGYGLVLR